MQLLSKIFFIIGCIFLLSLHLQTAIAVPSSDSFDVTIQPIYHFIEPGKIYEYTSIIQISSSSIGQTLSMSWTTTSPFLKIIYKDSIQLDETEQVAIGYSLQTENAIPSGDYQIEYEIKNQAGIAYGGYIPVRVYHQNDPDVVNIELQALSPFNDVRYSQVDISIQYNGDWHVLTPSINYNHSLRLITGEYQLTITDIITDVQIKDFKSITTANNNDQFQYKFSLIQFDLLKLSFNEINFVVTNFLGVQNAELVLKNLDGDVLANYEFVINNGINQFSFPMPKDVSNQLELVLSINDYSQRLVIELSDQVPTSEEFSIQIFVVLSLFMIGLAKFVIPRVRFRHSPTKISETEVKEAVAEVDNASAD